MKLVLASDHGGYELKEEIKKHLLEKGYDLEDIGTHSTESVDYPEFGRAAAEMVAAGKADKGVADFFSFGELCKRNQGNADKCKKRRKRFRLQHLHKNVFA